MVAKGASVRDVRWEQYRKAYADYTIAPFDSAVINGTLPNGVSAQTWGASDYRCPSSDVQFVSAGEGTEYDSLLGQRPALSNYMAIVGTHVDAQGVVQENGILISRNGHPRPVDAQAGREG